MQFSYVLLVMSLLVVKYVVLVDTEHFVVAQNVSKPLQLKNLVIKLTTQDSDEQSGSHELWRFTSILYTSIRQPVHSLHKEVLREKVAVDTLFF